jgi:uncharacterized protein (TIGR03000 family)
VTVPGNARLTIDGQATRSTAETRTFVTPVLQQGYAYPYTLRAEVTVDGRTEVISRQVWLQPGQELRTTLTPPTGVASTR